MNLADLTNEYRRASEHLEALFQNEEITQDVVADSLSGLKMDLETKILSIADYIKALDEKTDALKARIDTLNDRRKAAIKKAESLLDYVKQSMKAVSIDKIEGLDYVVSLANNPPSLSIENEDLIPSNYFKFSTSVDIDKKQLKKDLSNGLYVEGARLKQGTSLRIK